MLSSGLGHAASHKGSDTLITIPGARYFYNEPEDQVCINSVNASEHSVSTTKIFTVGEKQMIIDWLKEIPTGIFSMVCDTFSTWEFINYLKDPEIKSLVLNRAGKLVVRPDSGDPVKIIAGWNKYDMALGVHKDKHGHPRNAISVEEEKGVVELLWDIFGGTINEQGYKVLDPHIGAIYGDSINLERQEQIYKQLAEKGFASTNIVLGVGSYTYQYTTRDTLGFAAKGCWFEANGKQYDIYKDPITDDGTKKSLKGLLKVVYNEFTKEYECLQQQTLEQEQQGLLHTIFEDGKLYNQTTLTKIRQTISEKI
jgi:nicotinamide phosphoribosyltransferase